MYLRQPIVIIESSSLCSLCALLINGSESSVFSIAKPASYAAPYSSIFVRHVLRRSWLNFISIVLLVFGDTALVRVAKCGKVDSALLLKIPLRNFTGFVWQIVRHFASFLHVEIVLVDVVLAREDALARLNSLRIRTGFVHDFIVRVEERLVRGVCSLYRGLYCWIVTETFKIRVLQALLGSKTLLWVKSEHLIH